MKLVNTRNDDITDGNPKLTLGLIWTIILHFQVSLVLLGNLFSFRFLHTSVMNGSTLDLKVICANLHYVSNVYLKVLITLF